MEVTLSFRGITEVSKEGLFFHHSQLWVEELWEGNSNEEEHILGT